LELSTDGTVLTWRRLGACAEVEQVTLEQSADETNYSALGRGARVPEGWRWAGLSLPRGQTFYLRARGRSVAGYADNSSALFESVSAFSQIPSPLIVQAGSGHGGEFRFGFTNTSGAAFTVLATTNLSLPAAEWEVLGPALPAGDGVYQFTDP